MVDVRQDIGRVGPGVPLAPTLGELGTRQLKALAKISDDFTAQLPRITQLFVDLLGPAAATNGPPRFQSDVVDDHTPYEMSLAIGGAVPELRLLVETTGEDPSLVTRWHLARSAGRHLRDEHGADLSRLEKIMDLFEPREEHGQLAMWHAVAFRPGLPPDVKVYLDLRARGSERSRALLEEALGRLGLAGTYPRLMREAGCRGTLDELVYFSLDLVPGPRARVKVYFRHHQATAEDAERVIGKFGGVEPGEVRAFCTAILGHEGPYIARPLVSCWAFTEGTEPAGATLYAPIAYYVRDDEVARTRILRWLEKQAIPREGYERSLAGFARRPLDAGVGMHSYVSFKRDRGVPKLTAYLAPEAYQTFAPGSLAARRMPVPRRPRSGEQLVDWYETVERVVDHPLFRRLAREAPALGPVWTLLANNWIAVGDRFPRWLAALVARVDNDRIRSLLAKQLNDELGAGNPDRAHRVLFQTMLADLEPFAPSGDREAVLMPGRRFAHGLANNYLERPEYEALGGTVIAEIYGKQVDQAIGDLVRRQRTLDPASLEWLVLHETLEEDHADESRVLARMTPPAAQAALCRGAENLAAHGQRYFDDLYEVIFR